MREVTSRLPLLIAVFGLLHSSCAFARNCQTDNASLQKMPAGQVSLLKVDGDTVSFAVKIADTNQTRSAGFQRICENTIEATPILFVFDRPVRPSFHMHNVVAPIDIAFIRADGSIDSIHHMQPYTQGSLRKPLYSSSSPIVAALEVGREFFQRHAISMTDKVSWQFRDVVKP